MRLGLGILPQLDCRSRFISQFKNAILITAAIMAFISLRRVYLRWWDTSKRIAIVTYLLCSNLLF